MTDAAALDPLSLDHHAQAVQTAYEAALAAHWSPEARDALWHAAIQAVLAYAGKQPNSPGAQRFYRLLVDMAPDAPSAGWSDDVRRALRLAATHTLVAPVKPQHRPRAQAILRQLDLQDNPLLLAREQVLSAIARQQQALRASLGAREGEARISMALFQTSQDRLGRVASALRNLAFAPGPAEHAAAGLLEALRRMVDEGALSDPASEAPLYALLQQLHAPLDEPALLPEALAAIEAVVVHAHPAFQAGRQALLEVLYNLTLASYNPEEAEPVRRYLTDLAHIARHLPEIPAASLPGLLFRLRIRLADPLNTDAETLIDEGLALHDRLSARRQGLEQAIEAWEPDGADAEQALLAWQQALWELEQLDEALAGLRTAGLSRAQLPGVLQLFRRIDELAAGPAQDPETFSQIVKVLAEQLHRPRLIGHRVWHAGKTALHQLVEQRRVLEETLRGSTLDRRLDEAARAPLQARLRRQIEALDRARLVFGSLPFDRVPALREGEAIAAIGAFNLGVRKLAVNGEPAEMRQALDRVMQICRAPLESTGR